MSRSTDHAPDAEAGYHQNWISHEIVDGVARGNIVYDNGGECIISYGQYGGTPATGATLFEQNVSFDNWSMEMYISGQPNGVARLNILFDHPMDPATLMYQPTSTKWQTGSPYKFAMCFGLSDEYEGEKNGVPVPVDTQLYDNLMAGCRIGIMEYAEGNPTISLHTRKGALIAHNTVILPPTTPRGPLLQGCSSSTTKSPTRIRWWPITRSMRLTAVRR